MIASTPSARRGAVFLIAGQAIGQVAYSETELSFWGGVDPHTGLVIDQHHDLSGTNLKGRILAIPAGRGSCASSGVVMELLLSGHAPAALLLERFDDILTFGVIVAEEVFGKSIPVIVMGEENFCCLQNATEVVISNSGISVLNSGNRFHISASLRSEGVELALDPIDKKYLSGSLGKAAQIAMRIITRTARFQGATRLHTVSQVHIDGCFFTGAASLSFAEQMRAWGASVAVPTTLNATSIDVRQWRSLNIDPSFAEAAVALTEAYVSMGARPTFTCAPYLLDELPRMGEQIAWAESNAVVYANSVLGARTLKYPDYLDACIALTGRAPYVGSHTDQGRLPKLVLEIEKPSRIDEEFYPVLGYAVGRIAADRVPMVHGLEDATPSLDDLKAFSAAFAVTSSAPMFHIRGVTLEAALVGSQAGDPPLPSFFVGASVLGAVRAQLDASEREDVGLVSLGNPHFSLSEFRTLVRLCRERRKHPNVSLIVTCGRHVHEQAVGEGIVGELEAFGARLVMDTCWCLIQEPIISPSVSVIMTNSAKYAHYGPGLTGREFRFGNVADCVEALCSGVALRRRPAWLGEGRGSGTDAGPR